MTLPIRSTSIRPTRRGFTLIEIMVVVAIIVILAAILLAVGAQVKRNSQIASTKTTLKTLTGLMTDYLKDGNPEPTVSDTTTFVKALNSSPEYSKKIAGVISTSSGNVVINDAFGTPIKYIPYNAATKKEGYFESAGPDRIMSTADDVYSTEP